DWKTRSFSNQPTLRSLPSVEGGSLSLRLDLRPVLVEGRRRVADVLQELAPRQRGVGGVDRGVVEDLRTDEPSGPRVRARVADTVHDRGGDLRLQDVVEEGVDRFDVAGASGDADAVHPDRRSLLRQNIAESPRVARHDLGELAVVAVGEIDVSRR